MVPSEDFRLTSPIKRFSLDIEVALTDAPGHRAFELAFTQTGESVLLHQRFCSSLEANVRSILLFSIREACSSKQAVLQGNPHVLPACDQILATQLRIEFVLDDIADHRKAFAPQAQSKISGLPLCRIKW